MRKIHARGLLRCIAYDINTMLDQQSPTKDIYASLKKRLKRIRNTSWQRVDWN